MNEWGVFELFVPASINRIESKKWALNPFSTLVGKSGFCEVWTEALEVLMVNGKIVGLNFMQGSNNQRDYELFKYKWGYSDVNLTNFYDSMLYTFPIEKASVDKFTFINKCMWAYFSAQDKTGWASYGEEYVAD